MTLNCLKKWKMIFTISGRRRKTAISIKLFAFWVQRRRGLVWASFYDTEFTLRDKVRALKGHDVSSTGAKGARKGGAFVMSAHMCNVATHAPAARPPLVFLRFITQGSEWICGFGGL